MFQTKAEKIVFDPFLTTTLLLRQHPGSLL
jgi:hypothetical protein